MQASDYRDQFSKFHGTTLAASGHETDDERVDFH
jgi:hypothetical protein